MIVSSLDLDTTTVGETEPNVVNWGVNQRVKVFVPVMLCKVEVSVTVCASESTAMLMSPGCRRSPPPAGDCLEIRATIGHFTCVATESEYVKTRGPLETSH